jgi:hypothetical protein
MFAEARARADQKKKIKNSACPYRDNRTHYELSEQLFSHRKQIITIDLDCEKGSTREKSDDLLKLRMLSPSGLERTLVEEPALARFMDPRGRTLDANRPLNQDPLEEKRCMTNKK